MLLAAVWFWATVWPQKAIVELPVLITSCWSSSIPGNTHPNGHLLLVVLALINVDIINREGNSVNSQCFSSLDISLGMVGCSDLIWCLELSLENGPKLENKRIKH